MNENRVVSLRQRNRRSAHRNPAHGGAQADRAGRRDRARHVPNASLVLPDGRQRVVRHGHDPVRTIQRGLARSKCKSRRLAIVARRRLASIRFASSILPKWARRTKCLDALLPVLYLRGISAGDFQEAL
jgi:putative transposase